MAFAIRMATNDDIPEIAALIPVSARSLSAGFYTAREIESAITHVFGVDSQLVADGTYFVAVDGERIVGCGGWSKRATLYGGDQMKTDADPLLDPAHDAARIRAFFVDPGSARQGIGRAMIERCEAAARSEGFTRMDLVATLPGQPLYAALGYKVTELKVAAMPDGVEFRIALMAKVLPSARDSRETCGQSKPKASNSST